MKQEHIIFLIIFSVIFLAIPWLFVGWISGIDWIQYFVAIAGILFALNMSYKV